MLLAIIAEMMMRLTMSLQMTMNAEEGLPAATSATTPPAVSPAPVPLATPSPATRAPVKVRWQAASLVA